MPGAPFGHARPVRDDLSGFLAEDRNQSEVPVLTFLPR